RVVDHFGAGTAFVPLDAVTDPHLVLPAIGRAVGADLGRASPLPAIIDNLDCGAWLLLLDNLERASGVAPRLEDLLARCPGVAILATSRTAPREPAQRERVARPPH